MQSLGAHVIREHFVFRIPSRSQCKVQGYVEVPQKGPKNRREPAGLAAITFDSEKHLQKVLQAWHDKAISGRVVVLSRRGFVLDTHEGAA